MFQRFLWICVMSTIKRFEDIEAWQTAREVTRRIYEISKDGAFSRDFGLRDQMRRASVSIMSNVAEGFESRTRSLFLEFLGRAKASAGELRAQFYVAGDAGYLSQDQFRSLSDQCEKCSSQISRLMAYLKSNTSPAKPANPATSQRSGPASSKRSTNSAGLQRSNVPTFKRSNDA